jgi:hypothetical protein
MNNNISTVYCENCDKTVEYIVSEGQKVTEKIDDIVIEIIGKTSTCKECNSEVFPEEVFEYNRPIVHAEYINHKNDILNICTAKLNDKAKIILLSEPLVLSESDYIVSDILTTYSKKTGTVLNSKIILKDEYGRDLSPREPDNVMVINKDCDISKFKVSNEKEKGLGVSDSICKKCGGVVKTEYKHLGNDEDGEGGYYADISTCSRCGDRKVLPD